MRSTKLTVKYIKDCKMIRSTLHKISYNDGDHNLWSSNMFASIQFAPTLRYRYTDIKHTKLHDAQSK